MATAIYSPLARRPLSRPSNSFSLFRRAYYHQHHPTTLQAQQRREVSVSYSSQCPYRSIQSRSKSWRIPSSPHRATAVRWRSTEAEAKHEAKQEAKQEAREATQYVFEDIKALTTNPSPPSITSSQKILIDVREPSEFSAGHIPTSINIPLQSQPDALTLSEEDFEERFDFPKPGKDAEVVFYCLAGVRSQAAARVAERAGYEVRGEYRGSWEDWVERGGEVGR